MLPASRIASCLLLAFAFYLVALRGFSRPSVLTHPPTSSIPRCLWRRTLAKEHSFVPALDENIHYVGRWIPTPNRLRWDTAFPGAYVDLTVRNASVVYISLQYALSAGQNEVSNEEKNLRRMTLKPSEDRDQSAAPVAVTVSLCNGSVLKFPSSESGLLAVDIDGRPAEDNCLMRISHAGGASEYPGTFQFKGVWLPHGASLQPRRDTSKEIIADTHTPAGSASTRHVPSRKTIELVTDSSNHEESGIHQFDWLAQLAAQFDVNQVRLPAFKHCLTESCMETQGMDVSSYDLFFRSGPPDSALFSRPWDFHHYVPDVLLLDLGSVDLNFYLQESLEQGRGHAEPRKSHQSLESFTNSFVHAYMAFIQQVRRTAYPLHPSALDKYALEGDGYTYNSAPSTLPIFVMCPLDGSLARATLAVVEQMQRDGDKSVFWIDTSGWLSEANHMFKEGVQDERSLSMSSHKKVASFMHAHLCHYLAQQSEQCPFLRRDNYMGSAYVPNEAELDRVIEENKIKKLMELFWTPD